MIFHTGSQIGVSTALALFPEQEYVIGVVTNLGFNKDILDIILNIATNFA
jgi:hypothetical protein